MENNEQLTKEQLEAINGGYGFVGETACTSCGSTNVDLTGGFRTQSGVIISHYVCLDCGHEFMIEDRD